jgi:hypothetical protein
MTTEQFIELMMTMRSLADSMARIARVAEQGERRRGQMVAGVDANGKGYHEMRPMRPDHTERDLGKAVDYLNRAGE